MEINIKPKHDMSKIKTSALQHMSDPRESIKFLLMRKIGENWAEV